MCTPILWFSLLYNGGKCSDILTIKLHYNWTRLTVKAINHQETSTSAVTNAKNSLGSDSPLQCLLYKDRTDRESKIIFLTPCIAIL